MVSVDVGAVCDRDEKFSADQKSVTQIMEEIRSGPKTERRWPNKVRRTNPVAVSIVHPQTFVSVPSVVGLDVGLPLKPLGLHTEMLVVMVTNIGVFGLKIDL